MGLMELGPGGEGSGILEGDGEARGGGLAGVMNGGGMVVVMGGTQGGRRV